MTTNYKPGPPAPSKELQYKYVGREAILRLGDLRLDVDVTAIRNRFGNIDALVTPASGYGEQWVLASKLTGLSTSDPR